MVGGTGEGMVEGTAGPGRLGAKATGSATDADLTTLPAEGGVMHVGPTRHLKGVTAAETGATVVVVVEVEVEVATVTEAAEGMTEVTTGVVEVVVEEGHLPSSLATGTAQTAVRTTLQAVKPATSAMRPSDKRLHVSC